MTKPNAGTANQPVTFTPTDTTNYNTVSGSVSVTINKAVATVTLSNMTQTYTGSPLTPSATTTPASLSISWTNAPQTNAGSLTVTATVNDSNYQGWASGNFTINQAQPTITWIPPTLAYGNPVGNAYNASVSFNGNPVSGTVAYSIPASAIVPPPGQSVTVTFTPAVVATNFATASAVAFVTVNNPAPANLKITAITGSTAGTNVFAAGSTVTFTGTFTDTPGDTHTALWNFDTLTPAASDVQIVEAQDGLRTVTAKYTFTSAGVYKSQASGKGL